MITLLVVDSDSCVPSRDYHKQNHCWRLGLEGDPDLALIVERAVFGDVLVLNGSDAHQLHELLILLLAHATLSGYTVQPDRKIIAQTSHILCFYRSYTSKIDNGKNDNNIQYHINC